MTKRVTNFSAGPAVLPLSVLEEIQRDMLSLPGCGASILEISHRSKQFISIIEETEQRLRTLLNVPKNYRVLFMQGGGRMQFSMVPMNLLRGTNKTADYILTGSWGKKALAEARREGETNIAWDGKAHNYDRLPEASELQLSEDAAYVHFTANETIEGVQFPSEPDFGGAPLVCDASSEFLWRPMNIERYGLVYACAQKNAGPAGVTVVLMEESLLERSSENLPGMLNYKNYAENESMYNTPPTFGIYVVNLVCKWLLEEMGGLEKMRQINQEKAALLYQELDSSEGFYRGHAQPADRSMMNVTFRLPNEALEAAFVSEAAKRDLASLKGHRSVGGIRASIYNAMPRAGVEALRDFMREFREKNSQ